ncbi:MAG: hypothetical protein FWG35_02590 [Spirochaetaceae bacterium]|nr:hypothetical protein [Spirochaetaceae bacterium]
MTISNTEKQARFRKKESLKRYADEVFRRTPRVLAGWKVTDIDGFRAALDKVADLPSGWTEEDYQQAMKKLEHMGLEQFDNPHLLENDVHDGLHREFMTTQDTLNFVEKNKEAIRRTYALAAHIQSTLELSGLSDTNQAAAVMEVVRFIGRSVTRGSEISKSRAITMCLASIGHQYARPDWFAESLAETLAWSIGKDLAHDVGKRLCEF